VAGGNERESLVSETDAVVSEERENREMSLLREKDATDRQTADERRLEGLDGMDQIAGTLTATTHARQQVLSRAVDAACLVLCISANLPSRPNHPTLPNTKLNPLES
jgi:hypothetical protein